MRRGDELPITGDQGELMGAGGGGDDAIGERAMTFSAKRILRTRSGIWVGA